MHEAQAREAQAREAQDGTEGSPAAETAKPGNDATPQPGRLALAVLGAAAALSLGGVVYSLYRLTGMADGLDDTGIVLLANSLFSPIIVTAFAGAVAGVIAARALKGPQKALAVLGFLVIGLAAALIAYASFSVDASIALVLASVLFGSAVIGGLFSLPQRSITVVAGLNAVLLLLAFMFARGLFEAASSVSLFSDPLDQYGALGTALPFVAGLACGLCAFLYLRKKQAGVKLLGHLLAGAIPGAIWLVSTIIAQIGVGVLLDVGLDGIAPLDSAFLALSFQWQYNGSMTAMFAGAFCAVLAYGLLMPKAPKFKAAKTS
jgi:hypothetical protein